MKIKGEYESRRIWIDDKELLPNRSQKVWNHSPDGFNWGYGGSGPSQLALAILLHITTETEASKFYQQFKWEYVAKFPENDFEQEIDILGWLKQKENNYEYKMGG